MRFCLFFVNFLTLRFMGFRQQQIRGCILGKNVIFNSDKSISFHWSRKFMKNGKEYRATLDPSKHKNTHGILIKALNLYHSKIYPYMLTINKDKIENHFFPAMLDNFGFRKFDEHERAHYHQTFIRWGYEFLDYDSVLEFSLDGVNPHFLRGICVDWLYYDLKVSLRNVADFIGDSESTVVTHYLRKKVTVDGNGALDEANRNIERLRASESIFNLMNIFDFLN